MGVFAAHRKQQEEDALVDAPDSLDPLRQRDQAAYIGLLVYMLGVHLPFHYLRVVPNTPWYGWLLLLTFTVGSVRAKPLALMQCSSMCRRVAVALIVAHTVANGLA